MKKRIISFVLIMVMAIGFMPTLTFAANTTEFAGGSGTEADPYLISTKTHLNNVRNYLDAHFKMIADIEFTDADFEEGGDYYNYGSGFSPISTLSYPFTGSFDGDGFIVKKLYTKGSTYAGLFGYNQGIIKNIGIANGDITAGSSSSSGACYAGGIAGYSNGIILNCYNTNTVTAITSANKAMLSCYAGGIVGYNSNGEISNCYNIGNITANSFKSIAYAGGIVGESSSGTITNCYNIGVIGAASNKSEYAGGIAGSGGTITNCYYLNTISASAGAATKCTAEQMSQQSTFVGFDFENVWTLEWKNCFPYPTLKEVALTMHNHQPTFDDDNHFDKCTGCGDLVNTKPHAFTDHCDTTCDCGYERTITHNHQSTFDNENHYDKCTACDDVINVKVHEFENNCDTTCNCGYEREITHDYKVKFDASNHFDKCTVCGDVINTKAHEFDNACDKDCACGYTRITTHKFDNACDTNCNVCDAIRTITHSFGAYIYNKDATYEKDGTRTRTCSVCGKTETVVAEGTKKTLINTSIVFTDIPAKKWFKEYVDYSVTYGIFSGTSANTFSPNDNITRAQFVQVLANLEGVDTSNRNISSGFTDVPKGKWYTAAVTWAAKNGIVNGVGAGKFDPNANVTREQMCVMLTNYAKFKGITLKAVEAKENFADDGKISKWAKAAVYICQQADIVNGKGAGMFDPKGTGTRAEACVIFAKFHKDFVA